MTTDPVLGYTGSVAPGDKILSAYWNTLVANVSDFQYEILELLGNGCFLPSHFNPQIVPGQPYVTVTPGAAIVGGVGVKRLVHNTGTPQSNNLPLNNTSYLWLNRDGTVFGDPSTGNQPANSLLIGTVVMGASAATSVNALPAGRINLSTLKALQALIQVPSISVGTLSGTTIAVTVQLQDPQGNPGARGGGLVWLSDAAYGAPSATAPSGGWAVGASGVRLVDHTANLLGQYETDSTGKLIVNITQAAGAAKTWYLNFRCGGLTYASGAIYFA